MVTDMVDLRVVKAGLVSFVSFVGAVDAAVSLSDATTVDFTAAREAGMMLSLFLASPEADVLVVPLNENAVGLVLRVAVLIVEGLALLVVGCSADFVGLAVLARVPSCLSTEAGVPRADAADDGSVLAVVELAGVGLANGFRYAARPMACFLFSSAEFVPALLSCSIDLIEALSRCPELAAVAAVTLVGGRREVGFAMGRVEGLLRPLPGVPREAEDVVNVAAGLGVVPDVRLAAAK